MTRTGPVSLAQVLALVVSAVEAEGEQLLAEFYLPGGARGAGSKAPIDEEIELRLRQALQAALPCRFVGEETGETPGQVEGWTWIVDPHDGTSDFIKGMRGSSISVGLVRASVPVLGVVHAPASPDRGRETFAWAEGAGPLRRNGKPVACDLRQGSLSADAIVYATSSAAQRPLAFSRAVAPARFVALPSVAHRLARIAAGDGVATLSIHEVNEYDIAAGAALLRASGGAMLDFSGNAVVFSGRPGIIVNGCFAGAPQAAAQLARFDWSAARAEERRARRVSTAYPKVTDGQRLARAQGCLLGQAIGDGCASGERTPSAATEAMLALARSLLAAGRYDAATAAAAYRSWLGSAPPGSAGDANTSAVALARAVCIGVWAAGSPSRAAAAAREDAVLTGASPACADACAACAAAVAAGVGGGSRGAMLQAALAQAAGTHASTPAQAMIERGARGEAAPASGGGEDLLPLQNAFFHLLHSDDFVAALSASRSAGIAAGLLGAAAGIGAIPPQPIASVLACRALAEAGAPLPRPMDYWPDDLLELAEALLLVG